jgi:hypothetical protein
MRHQLRRVFGFSLPLLASAALLGCYTQVGAERSERNPDRDYDRPETTERGYVAADDSTSYNQNDEGYNNDDYGYRHRWLGFDYYYPTVVVGASVWDPWYWDRWGSYYYSPFWCGTYYPGIYAGWYYPRYYSHYPNYYGGYYGGYNNGHRGGGYYGGTRTIGNTRGSTVRGFGGVRGSQGVTQPPASSSELPRGYRAGSTDRATPSSATPRVTTGRRDGSVRGSPGSGTIGRGGSTRGGGSRGGRRLERPSGSSAPHYGPAPRGSSGAPRGGGGRSYSPPPSSSGPSSAPSGGHSGGTQSGGGGGTHSGGGRSGSRR